MCIFFYTCKFAWCANSRRVNANTHLSKFCTGSKFASKSGGHVKVYIHMCKFACMQFPLCECIVNLHTRANFTKVRSRPRSKVKVTRVHLVFVNMVWRNYIPNMTETVCLTVCH